MDEDALGICNLHIYSGVGYCIVYFSSGFATTFLQISEISSTLFFFYYRHAGAK